MQVKVPALVTELLRAVDGIEVKVVTTAHARHFFDASQLPVPVLGDDDEWRVCLCSLSIVINQ